MGTLIPSIMGRLPESKTQLRRAIQRRPDAVAVDVLRPEGWESIGLLELPIGTHTLEVFGPPTVALMVEVVEAGVLRVRV